MELDLEQCQWFEIWHKPIQSLMSVAKKASLWLLDQRLVCEVTGPSTSCSLSWVESP